MNSSALRAMLLAAYAGLLLWSARMVLRKFSLCSLFLLIGIAAMAARNLTKVEAAAATLNALFPLLIFSCYDMFRRISHARFSAAGWQIGVISLSLLMIAISLAIAFLDWRPKNSLSFLFTLPLNQIVTLAFVITFGLGMLRNAGWPWLAAGALGMFFGAAAPIAIVGPVPRLILEIIFCFSLLITEHRVRTFTFDEHLNSDLH